MLCVLCDITTRDWTDVHDRNEKGIFEHQLDRLQNKRRQRWRRFLAFGRSSCFCGPKRLQASICPGDRRGAAAILGDGIGIVRLGENSWRRGAQRPRLPVRRATRSRLCRDASKRRSGMVRTQRLGYKGWRISTPRKSPIDLPDSSASGTSGTRTVPRHRTVRLIRMRINCHTPFNTQDRSLSSLFRTTSDLLCRTAGSVPGDGVAGRSRQIDRLQVPEPAARPAKRLADGDAGRCMGGMGRPIVAR